MITPTSYLLHIFFLLLAFTKNRKIPLLLGCVQSSFHTISRHLKHKRVHEFMTARAMFVVSFRSARFLNKKSKVCTNVIEYYFLLS